MPFIIGRSLACSWFASLHKPVRTKIHVDQTSEENNCRYSQFSPTRHACWDQDRIDMNSLTSLFICLHRIDFLKILRNIIFQSQWKYNLQNVWKMFQQNFALVDFFNYFKNYFFQSILIFFSQINTLQLPDWYLFVFIEGRCAHYLSEKWIEKLPRKYNEDAKI